MKIDNDNHIRDALLRDFPELATDEECLADTLDGISCFEDQASAVLSAIADCDALEAGIEQRIVDLKARKERIGRRGERLRDLLLGVMQATGRKKLNLPDATVSVSAKAKSVIIVNADLIPPGYMVTPPPPPSKPDKKAIKAAIDSGTDVPGCTLSNDSNTLRIRGT
jgi:hypothetical protein